MGWLGRADWAGTIGGGKKKPPEESWGVVYIVYISITHVITRKKFLERIELIRFDSASLFLYFRAANVSCPSFPVLFHSLSLSFNTSTAYVTHYS